MREEDQLRLIRMQCEDWMLANSLAQLRVHRDIQTEQRRGNEPAVDALNSVLMAHEKAHGQLRKIVDFIKHNEGRRGI